MTDRDAYVAFNLTDCIGSVGVGDLASRFGSVVAAWEHYPNKISRTGGIVDWQGEYAQAKKFGVSILTPVDVDYPDMLRKTRGHPLAIYVKGDVTCLSNPAVAIVGTRRATPYGRDQANRFAHELAEHGWCIVSGLAQGIDAEAHRGALDAGGKTVGVLGSALDKFFPDENRELAREMVRKGGAVISEFPFGREPDTRTFPQRNHIVAALAKGVLAIEAPAKSGTLITTSLAGDIGRTVMALPGRVDSRSSAGCLTLIRDGATLVRCVQDVEEALGELFAANTAATSKNVPSAETIAPAPTPPMYTLEESLIMKHVTSEGLSMEQLIDCTGLDVAKVSSLTMGLRIKGRVRFLPGNRVALPRQS